MNPNLERLHQNLVRAQKFLLASQMAKEELRKVNGLTLYTEVLMHVHQDLYNRYLECEAAACDCTTSAVAVLCIEWMMSKEEAAEYLNKYTWDVICRCGQDSELKEAAHSVFVSKYTRTLRIELMENI